MSSIWGERLKISIFGESHGGGIGVVLDGLPSGEFIDMQEILVLMERRTPGRDKTATARKEADIPEILSGIYQDRTTGAPLSAIIRNTDTRSKDYSDLLDIPRPGHADFTALKKYGGFSDPRGGGHFSGRLTAPLTFAGAVCRQILSHHRIQIAAHIYSISQVKDTPFDPINIDEAMLKRLHAQPFAVISPDIETHMRDIIEEARIAGNSVGGIVECAAVGLPAGIGSPIFGGMESRISSIMFGIPAVKGIEFGAGFNCSNMKGSECNDPFITVNDEIKTATNHHGGILGGITSGMPIIVRAAFKPTPSISMEQTTLNLQDMEQTALKIKGRHDPCIVPRAVVVVESALAVAILDAMLEV
jgi:chorismate synthase